MYVVGGMVLVVLAFRQYMYDVFPNCWLDQTMNEDEILCDSIPQRLLDNELYPSKINSLRRSLMISDPSCFERHFESFKLIFMSRLPLKHVMLHIPKTGGTSVCERVKKEGVLKAPRGNCWRDGFCPLWGWCENPQPTSCDELNRWPDDFVMNENWLDLFYCEHHTYSIMIREPVARTKSHINHFLNVVAWSPKHVTHIDETKIGDCH